MRVILRPRRNGKTRVAVETFLNDLKSALIVATEQERVRVINEYQIPANRRQHIVTPEGCRTQRGMDRERIIVDNADLILHILLRVTAPIDMITLTGGRPVWQEHSDNNAT